MTGGCRPTNMSVPGAGAAEAARPFGRPLNPRGAAVPLPSGPFPSRAAQTPQSCECPQGSSRQRTRPPGAGASSSRHTTHSFTDGESRCRRPRPGGAACGKEADEAAALSLSDAGRAGTERGRGRGGGRTGELSEPREAAAAETSGGARTPARALGLRLRLPGAATASATLAAAAAGDAAAALSAAAPSSSEPTARAASAEPQPLRARTRPLFEATRPCS